MSAVPAAIRFCSRVGGSSDRAEKAASRLWVRGGHALFSVPAEGDRPTLTMGESHMSTAAPARRPGAVTAAYVIWLIGAIVSLIGSIFALFVGILALTAGTAFGGLAGAAVGAVVLIFAIFVFIIAIIELIIVNRMRDGRNWARVVLTVLGILSLIGSIVPWFSAGFNSTSTWSIVQVVVLVIAIILMYVPAANAYFAEGGTPLAGPAVGRESYAAPSAAGTAPAAPPTTSMPAAPPAEAPSTDPGDGRPPVA